MRFRLKFLIPLAFAWLASPLDALDLPAPRGPYAVGCRLLHLEREPGPGLMVWVWYPASKTQRMAEPEAILPKEWADRRRGTLDSRLGKDAAEAMLVARGQFQRNAPLSSRTAVYPVLVFSPGLSWLPTDYSALTSALASLGYVVFGVAPTGFAGPILFPGGHVTTTTLGPADQSVWEQHLRFAIDRIAALQTDPASPFHQRLDLARLGLFGHSMGGAASMAVAASTPLVTAAANLDGDFMGASRDARPTQPLLLLSHPEVAGADTPALVREGLLRSEIRRSNDWLAVSSRSTAAQRFTLDGSLHLDFLDAALLQKDLIPQKLRSNRFSSRPGSRTLAITVDLLHAFFGRQAVAAAAASYPEVSLTTEPRNAPGTTTQRD